MDTSRFITCAELIDDLDVVIAKSRTKTGRNGKLLVLSRAKKTGPRSEEFLFKKQYLLATMRDTFIEPINKSLRISALLIFCHQSGWELFTYSNRTHIHASFTVRTPGFDLIVTSDY